MTKQYAIVDFGDWFAVKDWFHPQYGSHWLVLPHKTLTPEQWHTLIHKSTSIYSPPSHARILLAGSFADEGAQEYVWNTNQLPSAVILPHPVWQGNDKLNTTAVEEVHHLWCGFDHLFDEHPTTEAKKAATADSTVRDIVRRAALRHPALKLSTF